MRIQPEHITIEVRSVAFGRIGQIDLDRVTDLKLVKRFRNVGSWTMSLDAEYGAAQLLAAPGRGIIVYGPVSETGGVFDYGVIFSGPVANFTRQRSSADLQGKFIFQGTDDNIHLADALAFPQPSNADPTTQNVSHDVRTAAAETLLRGYLADNKVPGSAPATRAITGLSLLGTDQLRGGTQTQRARFTQLGELLNNIATIGGLGFDIHQDVSSNGIVFEVYQPEDKSAQVRMDIENDLLTETAYGFAAPTATRAIVGGQGEGVDRAFAYSEAAGTAEADWGRIIETFKDRRDTDDTGELDQEGASIVEENGVTVTSLAVKPNDQDTMRYSVDWGLGDIVTVVVDGTELSAVVTEAVIAIDAQGFRSAATIGDPVGFDFESRVAAKQQKQETRLAQLEKNAELPSPYTTATPNSLVLRDANGRAKIATPSASDDIANKSFVEGAVSGIIRIEAHVESDLPSAYSQGTTISDGGGASGFFPTSPYSTIVTTRLYGGRVFQTLNPKDTAKPVLYRGSVSDTSWNAWEIQARTEDVEGRALQGRASFDMFSSSALPSSFDTGIWVGNTGNDSGWPQTYATVRVTKAANDSRVVQEVFQAGAGEKMYYRTSISGTDAWGDWRRVHGDDGWANVSFVSGFTHFSSSYYCSVRRIGDIVYMRGLVKPTSGVFAAATDYEVASITSGYWPAQVHWAAGGVTSGDGGALIRVSSTGAINVRIGTTATDWVGLGTSWPVG